MLLGATALVLLAGCDLTGSTDPAQPAELLPTAHAVDAFVGTAGQPLADSVGVSVHDANGNVVRGAAVIFSPEAASGSVSSSVVISDRNGIAKVVWTLGPTPGDQYLTVTAGEASTRFGASVQP